MNSQTKTILATAALVAVIAGLLLWRQFQANARLQDQLDAARKQANTLKAQQQKLKTQLASQTLDLQVQQAVQRANGQPYSLTRPTVNPRAPMPGVYPNRAKPSDLSAAAQGQTEAYKAMMINQYSNFMQKMQFTPEQADAFIKILSDKQQQEDVIMLQNQLDPQMLASMRTMPLAQQQAIYDQHDQQLQQLYQPIEQNTLAQLQPLLGSTDNVDYYNTYADQTKERVIVINGLADDFTNAGVPPLTLDQEEQVVSLVYQYRTALNGSSTGGNPIPSEQQAQILQQAGAFLSPDQVTTLQKVMPSLAAPLHKTTRG